MPIDDVLAFWFGDTRDDEVILATQSARWFSGGKALDRECRERFADLVERALNGALGGWAATPRGALALVILLDQLTRNIFRGTPRAFAGDARAQKIVLAALERGDEEALLMTERLFLYMPLEHAEDLRLQDLCLERFTALAASAPPALRPAAEGYLGYAERHRDIISRFGRFPHRNPIVGRAHTPEEAAWLEGGGDTFGQTR